TSILRLKKSKSWAIAIQKNWKREQDYKNKRVAMNTLENQNAIFPKGDRASADYFTGTAWVNILVPQDETGSYAIGNVVFEPGCRNNWHKHPAGQILLITDGNGYYQEKGKSARSLAR